MAKTRNRIRTNDPVGLRNRLLDAAAAAFQSNGYEATSIHDLMRTTGVTGGALHHHFPTKKSIALAVLNERIAQEVASTWIDRVGEASSAANGILAVFDNVADALDNSQSVAGCPLGNLASELALGDTGLREAISQQYAEWRRSISEKISGDFNAGRASYAEGDADGFANVVISMFTGALTLGKAEQSTAALRASARTLRTIMGTDL